MIASMEEWNYGESPNAIRIQVRGDSSSLFIEHEAGWTRYFSFDQLIDCPNPTYFLLCALIGEDYA